MNDDPSMKTSKKSPTFANQVGAKASRKLKARRNSTQGVWFGLGVMGLIRLVGSSPDAARRSAWSLAGQAASRRAFLDVGAFGGRAGNRLFERLALGCQRRKGHAGGGYR
jgi:hypothetical protein